MFETLQEYWNLDFRVKSPMEVAKKSKIIVSKYQPVAQWLTSLQRRLKPLQHWKAKTQVFSGVIQTV